MGDSVGNISQQDKGIRDVGSYIFPVGRLFHLTYTFPMLNQMLKASGTFWLYGFICVLGFIFINKRLRETRGKSLEQIEHEFTR